MQRYNFRLQRVLEIKELMQDLRQRELGEAVQVLEKEKDVLTGLNNCMTSAQDTMADRIKGRFNISEVYQYYSYMTLLRTNMEQQEEKIYTAQEEVQKRNNKLIESYKEREIISRLEERRRMEHNDKSTKEEQGVIDEISGNCSYKKQDFNPLQIKA